MEKIIGNYGIIIHGVERKLELFFNFEKILFSEKNPSIEVDEISVNYSLRQGDQVYLYYYNKDGISWSATYKYTANFSGYLVFKTWTE